MRGIALGVPKIRLELRGGFEMEESFAEIILGGEGRAQVVVCLGIEWPGFEDDPIRVDRLRQAIGPVVHHAQAAMDQQFVRS